MQKQVSVSVQNDEQHAVCLHTYAFCFQLEKINPQESLIVKINKCSLAWLLKHAMSHCITAQPAVYSREIPGPQATFWIKTIPTS